MMLTTDLLKSKTAFEHQALEEKFHSEKIMNKTFSWDDYKRMLEFNYRFIFNFEDEVFDRIPQNLAEKLNLEKRRKLPLIQKDISEIGLNISTEINHQEVTNFSQAMGVMYVMEGASLGGNVIAKNLENMEDFKPLNFHFFRCYGSDTGKMWQSFKTILNESITTESDQQQCVIGAEMAYQFLLGLFE